MINFNEQPSVKISETQLITILNSIGLNWYGAKNLSSNDIEIIEDKLDICLEIKDNGDILLHDLNYVWEE